MDAIGSKPGAAENVAVLESPRSSWWTTKLIVELAVVLAIILMLSSISIPAISGSLSKARAISHEASNFEGESGGFVPSPTISVPNAAPAQPAGVAFNVVSASPAASNGTQAGDERQKIDAAIAAQLSTAATSGTVITQMAPSAINFSMSPSMPQAVTVSPPDSSSRSSGGKDGGMSAAQASAIKAFTAGWGKASGAGTGVRQRDARDESEPSQKKAQQAADSARPDVAKKRAGKDQDAEKDNAEIRTDQIKESREKVAEDADVKSHSDRKASNAPSRPVRKFDAGTPREDRASQNEAIAADATRRKLEEIKTASQPFSTFSLHVSDVSFLLAKDALARGGMPDPDRIRPEEFYNAFDYRDPPPAGHEEVACRIEQCAHPFLQQRNLVRIAMKVAAAGRNAGQPLRLTVLLDTSGSMEREDRAASVRQALQALAALLGPNDRITLIGFARTPRLLAEQVPGNQAIKLVEIAARTPSEGGTNLELALELASEMARKQQMATAQNRIILLTDGAANLGDADPARLAQQIEGTRQQGISFDACGVGANGLNDEILEALTRKGDGRYYFLNKPEDADAGFARQLAGAFRPAAENVKVQVRFNPGRVSKYRLIGFESHLLKKEDFHNDKVGAAELAAEEAGVAVYQVETLPEGEGELGEVSVRFRDPSEGRMVERLWTMPYDAKAPSFDRAAPSMQLAATAALLAENLRGNPEIDLRALAPAIAPLRAQFSNQARVVDLIQMIERLRK